MGKLAIKTLRNELQYHIFASGTYPESTSPKAETGGDIITGIAFSQRAIGIFKDEVCYQGSRPDLSVMSMTAELEVYPCIFSFRKVIWLMVQKNSECAAVGLLHYIGKRSTARGVGIVPADDCDSQHVS